MWYLISGAVVIFWPGDVVCVSSQISLVGGLILPIEQRRGCVIGLVVTCSLFSRTTNNKL